MTTEDATGAPDDDAPATHCYNCGGPLEPDDDGQQCKCCPTCYGQGFVEDGGCGGGCEFCRPFPRCGRCDGTGKVSAEPRR